jgi:hypothetical protein
MPLQTGIFVSNSGYVLRDCSASNVHLRITRGSGLVGEIPLGKRTPAGPARDVF